MALATFYTKTNKFIKDQNTYFFEFLIINIKIHFYNNIAADIDLSHI